MNQAKIRIVSLFSRNHLFKGVFWAAAALAAGGCFTVRTEHKIEPIHMTVDVYLRIDRELDSFFADLDKQSQTLDQPMP